MLLNVCVTGVYLTSAMHKVTKLSNAVSRNRLLSTMASKIRRIEEQKIKVGDRNINYVRVGTGNHPVLLLPGALGTAWTDFKPQLEGIDTSKFTLIAWDPPGFGKSRPPNRSFTNDFFQRDAAWAHDLMNNLGYLKFSLIGWSDGGITSLLLAATYPKSICKMVVFGANAYIHPDEIKIYESIRDIKMWSERMKAPMIEIYGEDYFQQMWSDWVDALMNIYKIQNGDICKQALPKIECPTLILHGAKDKMVLPEHPLYLKENIANSKLHIFENAGHNLHIKCADEFNTLVTTFLGQDLKSKI